MSEWERAWWDEHTPATRWGACTKCGSWQEVELTGWECPNCHAAELERRRKAWGAYEVRYTSLRRMTA